MDAAHAAAVVAGSFATGVLGGMLGVGGGVFLVPFLVFFDVARPKMAVAISLCSVICTSAASSLVSTRTGDARLSLALKLEPPLIAGAVVASLLGTRVDDKVLIATFGVLILLIAVLIKARRKLARESDAPLTTTRLILLLLAAFASGAASGFFGVGGGVLIVPALVLIGRLPLKAAASTSALCLMMTATAGAAVHHAHDPLPADVVAAAILGVLPGGLLGAKLQKKAQESTLEWLFISLAVVVAGLSFWRGLA